MSLMSLMPENTQAQGRSYYTERNYAFTPSARAAGNVAAENLEWERGLLRATRVGDVTFDEVAKAEAITDPSKPPAGDQG